MHSDEHVSLEHQHESVDEIPVLENEENTGNMDMDCPSQSSVDILSVRPPWEASNFDLVRLYTSLSHLQPTGSGGRLSLSQRIILISRLH